MNRTGSPTVRRRRLASELRRLREAAGLTIDEVGEKLECSASKVSRLETGQVGVNPRDARDLLRLYGVDDDQLEALVVLAREARKKGWWHAYNEVFTGAFVGLESEAATLRAFQALLVPGLLQTEDYTRAVIKAVRPDATDGEVERRVAARAKRQKLLVERDPPQYWAVLDEAVLWRTIGGVDVHREQLRHICALAALPHVTVQVVPFNVGAHSGLEGPFLILGFPDPIDPDVAYVENTNSGIYLEQPEDVNRYTLLFDHLRAAALRPEDSIAMVEKMVDRKV
ncbi:MAG: helix-turn-helix domain-containing protein [Sciscionella sp.]|nr:helix-turn-helix domain-containing protein [Sciscionella sp.]